MLSKGKAVNFKFFAEFGKSFGHLTIAFLIICTLWQSNLVALQGATQAEQQITPSQLREQQAGNQSESAVESSIREAHDSEAAEVGMVDPQTMHQEANIAAEEAAKRLATEANAAKRLDEHPSRYPTTTQPAPITSSSALTITCGDLFQEAEDGELSGAFTIAEDPLASGGKYVATPEGSGNYYNGPIVEQKVEFCFDVPITGTYAVLVGTYAADSLGDSFYAQIDQQPASGYLWDIFPTGKYVFDYMNDRFIADPVEVQLAPGPHTVTIFVREDGARLDTINLQLVTPDASPTPVCAGLFQEAEAGVLVGDFEIGVDSLASGGKYIHAPEGTGNYWYGPNTRQIAKYCFNVPENGIYRIDGGVFGPDLLSDSFYLRVDNAPSTAYLWDVLPNTTYLTDSVNSRGLADPVLVKLPSGQHTVTVYVREDGTRLDTLQLFFTETYTEGVEGPGAAKPISGTIRPSATLTQEIDFSEFFVSLLDAETHGQQYHQRVQVDRFGRFSFTGMLPGEYVVVAELPTGFATPVQEVVVTATLESGIEIAFDIDLRPNYVYLPLVNR